MTMLPDAPNKPAGRPSLYSEQTAAEICLRLAQGDSLTKVCTDPEMPSKSTVLRWLHLRPEFREQYALAKQISLDDLADLALHEATSKMDPAYAQCARLAFDARRWYLSKLSPKKWGDRATVEHSGVDGAAITLQAMAAPLSPPEVTRALRDLLLEGERAAGLPSGEDLPDAARLQRLLASKRTAAACGLLGRVW
jgi:hypothetical protein